VRPLTEKMEALHAVVPLQAGLCLSSHAGVISEPAAENELNRYQTVERSTFWTDGQQTDSMADMTRSCSIDSEDNS
jgi:hypothetical protein